MPQEKHGPNRTNRPNEPEPTENLGRWVDQSDFEGMEQGQGGNASYHPGAFGDSDEIAVRDTIPGSPDDAYPDNREIRESLEESD